MHNYVKIPSMPSDRLLYCPWVFHIIAGTSQLWRSSKTFIFLCRLFCYLSYRHSWTKLWGYHRTYVAHSQCNNANASPGSRLCSNGSRRIRFVFVFMCNFTWLWGPL